MKKALLFLIACFILVTPLAAQCSLDHWEAVVKDNTQWRYFLPAAEMAGWINPGYSESAWSLGPSGIGYGDGDDNTGISASVPVVYMRKTFSVTDLSAVAAVIFSMDYDDGFVAYLNGVEIGRSNIIGTPAYNSFASGNAEALLYQGQSPGFSTELTAQQIADLLVQGDNLLAVEVHNAGATSSDLTARPFLHFGISTSNYDYLPAADWFTPPASLYTHLPIVKINTMGQTIMDDPRISCLMSVIDNGEGNMNCIYDAPNAYNGGISIEYRGSSSQDFPKKPYGFSTIDVSGADSNVVLLGFPEENDWIFLAPYTDKTFMRDVITYDWVREMNWYSSRAKFVELIINNEYMGVYALLEKIKRDDNRVNIGKITPTANSGDSLTGGYIFKFDKITGDSGPGFNTGIADAYVQFHDPEWDEVTPAQATYLHQYVDTFEASLFSSNFSDPSAGYRKYANIYSFIDLILINELSGNVDGYRLSTFMHKDRDSKCGRITMGPWWDYNLTYGNADYCNMATSGWMYNNVCQDNPNLWFEQMLTDPYFADLTHCRWEELRSGVLSNISIMDKIDNYADQLRDAAARDSAVWQTIGNYVWPNGWVENSWQEEINHMKSWITARLIWMDANMFGSGIGCNAAANVSLTVDEINYHSADAADAGDWLELWNYGTSSIDLSNYEILDGDTYEKYCVIPSGTILDADARLVLHEDGAKFAVRFPTVSNTARLCLKLSNGGQKIVVRDAGHRLVTAFTYSDSWLPETDGGGKTLQRTNTISDPGQAGSWVAGCPEGSPGVAFDPDCGLGIDPVVINSDIRLYPNPASNRITIDINGKIEEVMVYDALGRKMAVRIADNSVDVHSLNAGIYYLRVNDSRGKIYNAHFSKQ